MRGKRFNLQLAAGTALGRAEELVVGLFGREETLRMCAVGRSSWRVWMVEA